VANLGHREYEFQERKINWVLSDSCPSGFHLTGVIVTVIT
jgi:hypothetical protein